MVDIEHGGLAALHQYVLSVVKGVIELHLRLNHHRRQTIGVGEEVFDDFVGVDGLTVVHLHQDLVLYRKGGFNLLAQDGFVENVLYTDTHARNLVGIGRTNTAAGGANGALAQEAFLHAVQNLVVGGNQVSIGGNPQARGVSAAGFKPVDLRKQCFEVNHHTIAQYRDGVFG